jgi:hypothetical protein
MNIKSIKQGSIVETTVGVGLVKHVGGTHPPSVQVVIVTPIPRGLCNVRPRDVLRVLPDAEVADLRAQGLNLG